MNVRRYAMGTLLLLSVVLASCTVTNNASSPLDVAAKNGETGEAATVTKNTQPSSSFTPPADCVEDQALAAALSAVQACVQRFSPTHEFAVVLREFRLRSTKEGAVVSDKIAAMAVTEHIAKLHAANEGQPGQTLGMFKALDTYRPKGGETGADYCSIVNSVVIDRRVPGYKGEEFRIWAQTFVCARADASDNSVQVVELRASERFRVKTDQFRERFETLSQVVSAIEAQQSLRMY